MEIIITEFGSIIGHTIEGIGIAVIASGFIYATIVVIFYLGKKKTDNMMDLFRRNIKRNMVLGLDFLVAGDIIRTVTVDHSLTRVASLGLLVLIRTMLVFTIHLEIYGHWPWQKKTD